MYSKFGVNSLKERAGEELKYNNNKRNLKFLRTYNPSN